MKKYHTKTSRIRSIHIQTFMILLMINFIGCTYNTEENEFQGNHSKIKLRWVKNYPTETEEEMITGLYWGLSQLGAKLPKSEEANLIQWKDEKLFELNLDFAGFDKKAISAISKLNKILIDSEEYEKMKGIDVGRFIMLTINSSNHYFKISGLPNSLDEVKTEHKRPSKSAYVINSSIAIGDRKIEISDAEQYNDILYIAAEGSGELLKNSFEALEFETIDVMENGQLRFGLFDIQGDTKPSADKFITQAGKPAKCMWCHESQIQPLFKPKPLYEEVMTVDEFMSIRAKNHDLIDEQRAFIDGLVKYENLQDHTLMELLYISFHEPSARRLSLEWQISEPEIIALLAAEPTHKNVEFNFLGEELYWRNDIDEYSPYNFVQTPTEPREESEYEPDLID